MLFSFASLLFFSPKTLCSAIPNRLHTHSQVNAITPFMDSGFSEYLSPKYQPGAFLELKFIETVFGHCSLISVSLHSAEFKPGCGMLDDIIWKVMRNPIKAFLSNFLNFFFPGHLPHRTALQTLAAFFQKFPSNLVETKVLLKRSDIDIHTRVRISNLYRLNWLMLSTLQQLFWHSFSLSLAYKGIWETWFALLPVISVGLFPISK